MSSLPPVPSTPPTIPLTEAAHAAYQNLYDQYEMAIEASNDASVVQPLLSSQANIEDVLTKDAMYKLHADTALFEALTIQINGTNAELLVLKNQIAAIASKIATAGTILAAIDKVLSLTGIV